MNRPNFEPIFESENEFCEVSSSKPFKDFIPGQALDLKELVSRFERGQRLNVHNNFAPGANFENISAEEAKQRIMTESIDSDDFPPTDVHDVVDVERHYREHETHKREFQQRMKEKKQAQQEQRKQSQQAQPPAPPQPAPPAE